MEILFWALAIVAGYLLGNINGAIIISKWLMKDDVRKHGSGNAGLTNFFRTYGGFQSLLVIVLDIVKCVLACLLAGWLLPAYGLTAKMAAGVACILGHSYPVFAGFRGGKGILSGLALAASTDWRIAVVILALFIVVVALTRYVSLGSILATLTFGILYSVLHWGNWPVIAMAWFVAVFVIWRHRSNVVRLCKGTESKLSFHKKK